MEELHAKGDSTAEELHAKGDSTAEELHARSYMLKGIAQQRDRPAGSRIAWIASLAWQRLNEGEGRASGRVQEGTYGT